MRAHLGGEDRAVDIREAGADTQAAGGTRGAVVTPAEATPAAEWEAGAGLDSPEAEVGVADQAEWADRPGD
jgi:hypothetical protein